MQSTLSFTSPPFSLWIRKAQNDGVRFVATARVREFVLQFADEEVAKEQSTHGMLDAFAHFERVVDELLGGGLLHADAAARNHDDEVQAGDEKRSVLHLLV